jgi:enolase
MREYNQLLRIEEALGREGQYAGRKAFARQYHLLDQEIS